MKNYDLQKESSYLLYLDLTNLYGWAMPQKLPVEGFKWEINATRFDEEFIKNYNENSNKGYILDVTIDYPKNLHDLHSDLPINLHVNAINVYAIYMIYKLFT